MSRVQDLNLPVDEMLDRFRYEPVVDKVDGVDEMDWQLARALEESRRERGESPDRQDLVRLAGFEPATPSLEGSCSGPSELQAPIEEANAEKPPRQIKFNSAGNHFCAALVYGGRAVTHFIRGWLSIGIQLSLAIIVALAELDSQLKGGGQ